MPGHKRLIRRREEAAIGRTVVPAEDGSLALESRDAAMYHGNSADPADVVDEVAGGVVIRTIYDQVTATGQAHRIVRREATGMHVDLHARVQGREDACRGRGLRLADVGGGVEDLALQVAELDVIVINDADPDPDTLDIGRVVAPPSALSSMPFLIQSSISTENKERVGQGEGGATPSPDRARARSHPEGLPHSGGQIIVSARPSGRKLRRGLFFSPNTTRTSTNG